MSLRIFHHPYYSSLALPERHRFPLAKYQALFQTLSTRGYPLQETQAATRAQIDRVHDSDYVSAALAGQLDDNAIRQLGFPWSPRLIERTLLSVGATLAASRHALEQGCGLQISGGYHHAHRAHGSGFCLFNDLVIAAQTCLDEGRCDQVLIVDLDVHQGDGSAALCAGRRDIITLSLHGEHNFPRHKPASHLDFALPSGMQDDAYLDTLAQALTLALRLYNPDLVLYQAGVDVHHADELGYLALSDEGIRQRDAMVFDCAITHGLPVAAVPGGGYRREWQQLIPLHMALFEEARKRFGQTSMPALYLGP
ncbi:histone deacetylase family protein [Aeromonas salmonicida]|uniref:histone deacetylase family protein n=1 Tax=Aeromonas salmonicida TaxID=645 RepID=UPI00286429D9|nr:histone deacetylase [Aeromonas salmonicida]MDR7019005.1 acetoin utilization deacetylase AcuC-like enzyme [Aeromonas salmonicida]